MHRIPTLVSFNEKIRFCQIFLEKLFLHSKTAPVGSHFEYREAQPYWRTSRLTNA